MVAIDSKPHDLLLVDSEIKDLLPELSLTESEFLEKNIKENRINPMVTVWQGKNIIVDGHSTKNICDRLQVKYGIEYRYFTDRDDAIKWRLDIHLGRRNITARASAYYRGRFYGIMKKPRGGDKKSIGNDCRSVNVAKTLAEQYQVSERTIRNNYSFSRAVEKLAEKTNSTPQEIIHSELTEKDIRKLSSQNNLINIKEYLKTRKEPEKESIHSFTIGQVVKIARDRNRYKKEDHTDKRLIGRQATYAEIVAINDNSVDLLTWGNLRIDNVHFNDIEAVENVRTTAVVSPEIMSFIFLNYENMSEAIADKFKDDIPNKKDTA